ncbi:MAG: Smr/MutS family protein [Pseudomonadota bacterium]
MDRRKAERLRRGRMEPEARLDLHGMTADRAHRALGGFLLRSHAAGHRLVLVITGKGRRSHEEGPMPRPTGVLRHALPHWLAEPGLRPLILSVTPAHHRHGGGGAWYVYLRRRGRG